MAFILSKEQFADLAPKAKNSDELYAAMSELCPKYDVNTPERLAGFIAQCGHESAGFTVMSENLNYSADGLNKIFPKYFVKAGRDAAAYARNPEKIANVVYASRMGNGDTASGDGWKHRGRGYIQLTGKDNYTKFAAAVGKSVDEAVKYLDTVKGALESALWFWKANKLNDTADKNDITAMTKKINGGTIGLEDRKKHYEHALDVLGGKVAPKAAAAPAKASGSSSLNLNETLNIGSKGDTVAAVQKKLGLTADGDFGPGTKRAVKEFQAKNGLVADGVAGPKTLAKLLG